MHHRTVTLKHLEPQDFLLFDFSWKTNEKRRLFAEEYDFFLKHLFNYFSVYINDGSY